MPCNSISTTSLNLGSHDQSIMLEALSSLGLGARQSGDYIYFNTGYYTASLSKEGVLTLPKGYESMENKIKSAYSTKVVEKTAQKYGLNLRREDNKDGKNVFRINTRRR